MTQHEHTWPTPEPADDTPPAPPTEPDRLQDYLAARRRIRDAENATSAVQRVRQLHRKATHGDVCVHCAPGQRLGYDVTWPCDTIRALDGTAPAPEEQPIPYALVDTDGIRTWAALVDSGLLWLINRTTLHPYGLALALHTDHTAQPCGWSLLTSPDAGPWQYDGPTDADGHRRAMATVLTARHQT